MASMTDFLDEDSLQKMFKRMDVDATNQKSMHEMSQAQNMASATPPPNPYAQTEKKSGGWTSILSPIMKIGGAVATMAGMPYVGVPLSIAGGAVGGAGGGGGMSGALGGAVKSGIGQAASYGMGSALDALKTPVDTPISVGEVGKAGGMTIPGRRTEAIDMSSRGYTVPESPKSFGGGMS